MPPLTVQKSFHGKDIVRDEFLRRCTAALPASFEFHKMPYASPGEARNAVSIFCSNLFSKIDTKNLGHVGYRDLVLFSDVPFNAGDDHTALVQWVFKLYDLDGDDAIDPYELRTMVQASMAIAEALIEDPGSIVSGRKDGSRVPGFVQRFVDLGSKRLGRYMFDRSLKTMFRHIDADQNGRISSVEFRHALLGHGREFLRGQDGDAIDAVFMLVLMPTISIVTLLEKAFPELPRSEA
jgi:Ca2+-binding EF-hand superfamily protein